MRKHSTGLETPIPLFRVRTTDDQETKYTANWSRFRQIPYLNGVMISRRQARTRSVELFEDVLKNRKRRLASARGEGASDSSQAQSGWWKWLDRIKDELREEKVLILGSCKLLGSLTMP